MPTAEQVHRNRSVAFLFPGAGQHDAGMAQELYEAEPAFRETVDRCCAILTPLLGRDLRDVLYPAPTTDHRPPTTEDRGLRIEDSGADAPEILSSIFYPLSSELEQTQYAQPALFVVEYALAQLLLQWGVRPAALLGYSLGEYVAATLAGVLSLDDALRLVARRAQLIQQLPAGAMLAVFLPEALVRPLLSATINLAAVNGPGTCVLAGPLEAIAALEQTLAVRDIACRRVPTTHAFHSAMLAPVAEELTALARTLTLHPPQIPYLSNVTGDWITADEATDPAYWARHMLATVRFADGVGALLEPPEQVLLEVGPGAALSSFVKGHPACGRERFSQVLSTLPAAQAGGSDRAALLGALGRLWALDVDVDWEGFYTRERRRRIVLPTYPFERQRFWIEPRPQAYTGAASAMIRRPDIADWFSVPAWKRATLPGGTTLDALLSRRQHWLLLLDSCGVGAQLAAWLASHNQEVITVTPGTAFGRTGANAYTIRPTVRADYEALLQELGRQNMEPSQLVHLWTVTEPLGDPNAFELTARMLDAGFYSLLALAQALGDRSLDTCRISVVSNDMQDVTGDEQICPAKATVIGPCKIITQEYAQFTSRSIDIALPPDGPPDAALVRLLARELVAGPATEDLVALRGAYRWVQTYEAAPQPAPEAAASCLRRDGVYLITGGLGGIGLALAEHLAETVGARLILLERSGLPPREEWPRILEIHGAEAGIGRRICAVQALEAGGAEILLLQADVSDRAQVEAAVQQAVARFGTIHGVFHTAGVPGVGIIQLKAASAAAGVLAPKVQGTLALDLALRDIPLDFMVLCSSITSATGGGPGQIDYCAANAFLDTYARWRNAAHGPTIAISWGEWLWDAWSAGLQGYDETMRTFLIQSRRMYGISFAEGMEALRRALACDLPHVFVSTQDLAATVELAQQTFVTSSAQPERLPRALHPRPALGTSYAMPGSELEERIAAIWSAVLGIERIGINDNFFELGGNSLLGIDLIARMHKALGLEELQTYLLYDAPTVSALANHLSRSQPTQEQVIVQDIKDRADKGRANLKWFLAIGSGDSAVGSSR